MAIRAVLPATLARTEGDEGHSGKSAGHCGAQEPVTEGLARSDRRGKPRFKRIGELLSGRELDETLQASGQLRAGTAIPVPEQEAWEIGTGLETTVETH